MKKIGILGITPAGTVKHFEYVLQIAKDKLGQQNLPDILLSLENFEVYYKSQQNRAEIWPGLFLTSLKALREQGAEVISCPANSIFETLSPEVLSTAPELIHIADPVIKTITQNNYRQVLLLGTNFTVNSNIFLSRAKSEEIQFVTLSTNCQSKVHDLIVNFLIFGDPGDKLTEVADAILKETAHIDAIILGCTELFMLEDRLSEHLPVLDSNFLLAGECIARATS